MHSNGSIPVDKNMDEILASIRQTIQEDLSDDDRHADLYSSVDKLSDQPLNYKKNLNTGVLELTQMVDDDGTIVDLRTDNSKKIPQPILRRPYSPLDRTPSSDMRHYPESYTKKIDDTDDGYRDAQINDHSLDQAAVKIHSHTVTPPQLDVISNHEDAAPFETVKPALHYAAGFTNSIITNTEEYIMSDQTIHDSLAALGSLNMSHSVKDDHDRSKSSSQQTVESLVREMLRPLLKEWLDANLPTLVKWVVTEQVERVFKQQQAASHR